MAGTGCIYEKKGILKKEAVPGIQNGFIKIFLSLNSYTTLIFHRNQNIDTRVFPVQYF